MEWKHVVVGDVVAGSLKAAFEIEPSNENRGEIRSFRDDLSVGRIDRLMEVFEDRIDCFARMAKGTDFGRYLEDHLGPDMEEIYGQTLEFDDDDRIVIWHSGIVADQVALRYFAERFKGRDLWEMNLTKQKLVDSRGAEVHPRALGECPPEQLLEAAAGIEALSAEHLKQLRREWADLCEGVSTLRIFKNDRVVQVEESFYDRQLVALLTDKFQSAARVVGSLMGRSDQIVSDLFLNYRLRQLIEAGAVEARGSFQALHNYEVRMPGGDML